MVEVWFGLLALTLIVFVVLDGWDIGAGMLHWVAGRTSAERREIIDAHLNQVGQEPAGRPVFRDHARLGVTGRRHEAR